MKITANKALEILKDLGVKDVELVDDDAQVDYDQDTVLLAVDEVRTPIIRQKIEADLRKTIETTIAGKQGDKLRRSLRDKFGIALADLKDLDDEAAIAKAIDLYSGTLSKDTESLREVISKQAQEKADAIATLTAEKEKEVGAWKNKYADRHVLDHITEQLKDAPLNPKADKAAVAKMLKGALEADLVFDFDEDKNTVVVLDRATRAPKLNSAGTAPFSIKDSAESVLSPFGIWEKDTRSQPPVGPTNGAGQPYVPATPPAGGADPAKSPAHAKAAQMADMMVGK